MKHIISITRQGQLTVPRQVREQLGIEGQTQATLEVVDGTFTVKPSKDFWSLPGSLKSNITLSDEELQKAREAFSSECADARSLNPSI